MTTSAESTDIEQEYFVHSALLYHGQREYLDFVSRFVVDGLNKDEPTLVAVPGEMLAPLRDALRNAHPRWGAELRMHDISEIGRNPSRFYALEAAFADAYPGQRVRVVSQLVWPGRTADEQLACEHHEALVNGALEHRKMLGLCLYDASRLGEEALAGARATHPLLWKCGSVYRSSEYAPQDALARCNQPLPPHPGAVTYTVATSSDLRPARSFAVDYAGWVGLSRDGIEDLQMIATELATNSLQYTGGACQLAFWRQEGHVVCEARDGGRLDDPMVGRRHPGAGGTASRGLFLVNAMADLVRTHTAASGTTIQAYLRMEPSRASKG
jgi:anti-sigma regulatory factor (Ser/Thr protein kinase)